MAQNIIKIIDSKENVVSQTQVASGKSITVSAKEGQSYEFINGATKRAPDEIKTTREGNNLKVEIKDGDATSTTIIEDYYTNGEGDLVGLAEDGHYYSFVPQEMGADYMATDLADGVSSFQSLGSEGDSMSPWWLGLPLLALGAAGGGGGSGSANTLPDAPNLLMVEDNYNSPGGASYWGVKGDAGSWEKDSDGKWVVHEGNVNVTKDSNGNDIIITNDNTPTLSGTGEPGTTVRVYDGDIDPADPTANLVGEAIVADDGTWRVTTEELQAYSLSSGNAQQVEHTLNVTLIDAAGNESNPTEINLILDTLMTYDIRNVTVSDGNNTILTQTSGDNFYLTQSSFTISDKNMAYYSSDNSTPEDMSYSDGDEIYITLINKDTGEEYLVGGPDGPSAVVVGGEWSVDVNGVDDGHYQMIVTVREFSGDTYGAYSEIDGVGTFGIDTHAPDKSQIMNTTSSDHRLNVIVEDYEDISIIPASGLKISFGAEKLIFYRDGDLDNPVGEQHLTNNNVASDGKTSWQDDTSLEDGVYMYQVQTVDVAGNKLEGYSDKAWVIFDSDNSHDLRGLYDNPAKCFDEMELVGNNKNETFILDNVGFTSIDGGDGTDTLQFDADLTLDSNSGEITGFEVFDVGSHTLTISNDAQIESGIHINGDGDVSLDPSWTTSGVVNDHYYTYTNGTDTIYIQDSLL